MTSGRQIPVTDKVAQALRRRIANGELRAHEYLPPQRELAQEFHTSCRTVSEAISALSAEGLVRQTRGRGTRVLPPMNRCAKALVGVFHRMAEGRTSPQVNYVLKGIHHRLGELEYPFETVPIEVHPEKVPPARGVLAWPPRTQDILNRFGAVIFIQTFQCNRQVLAVERKGVPLVVANLEVNLNVSGTCVDHEAIMHRAVHLLASLGHRHIALLSRDPKSFFYGKSLRAWQEAMRRQGLPFTEKRIAIVSQPDSHTCLVAAQELLKATPRPTAIVTARDRLAQGVCMAVKEQGLAVGRDISVIGYDDLTWPQSRSFLTTFHEPCTEMGRLAADMLVARVVHGDQTPRRHVLETPLILRRSVGLAPDQPTEGQPPVTDMTLHFQPGPQEFCPH